MAKKGSSKQGVWSDQAESSTKLWMTHQYLIARKAALEPAYRKQLLAKPTDALNAAGMRVPKGAKIKVHVSSAKTIHIVLPPSPGVLAYPGVELADADLKSGVTGIGALGIDDFDIRRKKDAKIGNNDGSQDPKGDSDMSGDAHTQDHQK